MKAAHRIGGRRLDEQAAKSGYLMLNQHSESVSVLVENDNATKPILLYPAHPC